MKTDRAKEAQEFNSFFSRAQTLIGTWNEFTTFRRLYLPPSAIPDDGGRYSLRSKGNSLHTDTDYVPRDIITFRSRRIFRSHKCKDFTVSGQKCDSRYTHPKFKYMPMPIIDRDDKSKSCPVHTMQTLGGERKYISYSFLTSTSYMGELLATRPGRALPPAKEPRYPLDRRLGGSQSWSGHRG
jgi:hypothetical protein